MKLLIVRFSSIGDIVLTTPVVRALKLQLHAEIHYAVKANYQGIVSTNPYIDKVHILQNDLSALTETLKSENFDFVIDLHNNLRTRILRLRLGLTTLSLNKLNIEKWLMVNFKIDRLPRVHIVDRYMETVRTLGATNDGMGLDFFIPEKDEVSISDLPSACQSSYVAYAIGGQHATKKLPVERMIELCQRIGQPIVLLGGKEDVENGETIRNFFEDNQTGTNITVFNGCGRYNLNQSASLLKNAARVFTHDTGLMHIAAALKKEITVIWGNTIPAFGMYPYATSFINLENNQVNCRPCSKIGYARCPRGHFKCMREIVFDF